MSTDKIANCIRQLQWDLHELEFSIGIDRVKHPIDPLAFLREYVSRNKPVILEGCADNWRCLERWSREYLCDILKDKTVPVALSPDGRADSVTTAIEDNGGEVECFVEPLEEAMKFPDFVAMLDDKSTELVPYLQHQNDNFRSTFPELHQDLDLSGPSWAEQVFGLRPEAVNLWIGDERSVSSFHKGTFRLFRPGTCHVDLDHYENIYLVVEGTKDFVLLPPCASSRLHFGQYPHAVYKKQEGGGVKAVLTKPMYKVDWSPVRPEDRRWHVFHSEQFPAPIRVSVNKGEMLYLPSMWYHYVSQRPDKRSKWTVAVNFWYDMQFDVKYAYNQFITSLSTSHH